MAPSRNSWQRKPQRFARYFVEDEDADVHHLGHDELQKNLALRPHPRINISATSPGRQSTWSAAEYHNIELSVELPKVSIKMGCALLLKKEQELPKLGLDLLAEGLTDESKGIVTPETLLGLIEASLEQLEIDDTIAPDVTDALVDSLVEAQELFQEGAEPWSALEAMLGLYHQAKEQKSYQELWQDKLDAFTVQDLRTELWDNFQEACRMVQALKGHLLASWIELKISDFQSRQKAYAALVVAQHEITMESELCHSFLRTGIQSWLNALESLRSAALTGGDTENCLKLAEIGQRHLLAVQKFEAEALLLESRYFVNFN